MEKQGKTGTLPYFSFTALPSVKNKPATDIKTNIFILNLPNIISPFLSAYAEDHVCKAADACLTARSRLWWKCEADNPNEYGKIIEENFPICYESG